MKRKKPRTPKKKITFDILTIFPEAAASYFKESLFKRAMEAKILLVRFHDIRAYTTDKHHKVDDRPYGGGPGMVMKVEPIYRAVAGVMRSARSRKKKEKVRTILFSARGKQFDATAAKRLARYDRLILICGRYEGVDERVAEHIADEEVSIGPYVLSGGELPAMVLTEAVARFLPGFLGDLESLEDTRGSFPAYTRPPEFSASGKGARARAWKVPKVLQGGNHREIDLWRKQFIPPT